MDHLLVHCKYAYVLWSEIFLMFGIQWVMSKIVTSLIFGWRNWLGKHSSNIWNMVLACLMWLIWQECNNHTFEDIVRSTDLLKPILVGTLFQWVRIWGFAQCYSIFDFLLSVQISFWVICIHFKNRVFTIVNTMSYYAINYWLCIKKKKKLMTRNPLKVWDSGTTLEG